MKTNISVLPLSHLAVLIGNDSSRRSTTEVVEALGLITGGFLGVVASDCHLCHSVSSATVAGWAELCFALPMARIAFSLCLSLCQAEFLDTVLVCHEQSLFFLHTEGGKNRGN